jgi:hypothetical protein
MAHGGHSLIKKCVNFIGQSSYINNKLNLKEDEYTFLEDYDGQN